ncbi:MAG: hypothetical protein ACK6DB_13300, partial [Planctomycetota bacterium]
AGSIDESGLQQTMPLSASSTPNLARRMSYQGFSYGLPWPESPRLSGWACTLREGLEWRAFFC